jgi:hypothetical protein
MRSFGDKNEGCKNGKNVPSADKKHILQNKILKVKKKNKKLNILDL